MKKINTRAVCAASTAFFGTLGVGLPALDPANFWLGLVGVVSLSIGAGSGALLAFYDKLFPINRDEPEDPAARPDSP